ncbi:hypothetical protein SCP_0410130 [Sparassis crispa]|uniref:Protein N-terminal glutamine amidohydrolase n=1 Tax=Sparassis crispa TaxID=139825 RepID=A0A401GKD5_9APHY|nr:hypothetical protein SCP_0410130 [Sparassis crispa]GBE82628.1 hypothetical protein SCP_0410130 [Sparassis crispa]
MSGSDSGPSPSPIPSAAIGVARGWRDANASQIPSPPALPADSVYTSCYCEENVYLLAQAFTARKETERDWRWDVYAVFVSNPGKTVALWKQKARDDIVVWDYHVVLVLRPTPPLARGRAVDELKFSNPEVHGPGAWVYDFDTLLPVPCSWPEYVSGTFPYTHDRALANLFGETYQSLFRVVPADVFLAWFVSDRSHMLAPAIDSSFSGASPRSVMGLVPGAVPPVRYTAPPPPYPPLCGRRAREAGVVHNLMEFVSMSPDAEDLESSVARREGCYGKVMDMEGFVLWLAGRDNDGDILA